MIEAVNSVLANASLNRGSAAQVDVARANVEREAPAAPKAPFISPYISVDNNFNTAVIQIRNSETGDVLTQFPSESRLRARQQEQAAIEAQSAERRTSSDLTTPQVQNDAGFEAQAISSTVQSAPVANVAEAQQASVALSTGALSGQATTGAINVTA